MVFFKTRFLSFFINAYTQTLAHTPNFSIAIFFLLFSVYTLIQIKNQLISIIENQVWRQTTNQTFGSFYKRLLRHFRFNKFLTFTVAGKRERGWLLTGHLVECMRVCVQSFFQDESGLVSVIYSKRRFTRCVDVRGDSVCSAQLSKRVCLVFFIPFLYRGLIFGIFDQSISCKIWKYNQENGMKSLSH